MSDIFDAKSETGHDLPGFRTPDGKVRLLAALPNRGLYKYTPYSASNPVIPRSEWKSFARVRQDVPILDQGQVGSCNAHGFASSLMRARSVAGQQFQLLSASFLYALINGGRDQGSVPEDAANALISTGICLDSEVPEGFYTQANIARKYPTAPVTAKRFTLQAEGIYQVNSWDELVSAIILDFTCPMTVYVAGNWNNLDKNGCPPFRRGQGNHVVSDDNSLIITPGGDALIPDRNSWNTTWGNNGRFNYSEAAVDNQPGFVAYAIKWANQDPQDPNIVPSAN